MRRCIGGGCAVSTVDVARLGWALGGSRKPRAPRGHLRSEEEDGVELPDLARVGLTLPGPHFRTRLRGILGGGATPTAQATGKRLRRLRAPAAEQFISSPAGGWALKAAWSLYCPARRRLPSAVLPTSIFSFNRHGQPLRDLLIPTAQVSYLRLQGAIPAQAPDSPTCRERIYDEKKGHGIMKLPE